MYEWEVCVLAPSFPKILFLTILDIVLVRFIVVSNSSKTKTTQQIFIERRFFFQKTQCKNKNFNL